MEVDYYNDLGLAGHVQGTSTNSDDRFKNMDYSEVNTRSGIAELRGEYNPSRASMGSTSLKDHHGKPTA